MHRALSKLSLLLGLWFLMSGLATPAGAHPMGNFSINHYARFETYPTELRLRYILDFAEIPTVTERTLMHVDESGRVSDANRDAYLRQKAQEMMAGLAIVVDARPALPQLRGSHLEFQPGSGGLPILRLALDASIPLPGATPTAGRKIGYQDNNYPARTGWKEIVVQNGADTNLTASSAPTTDLSRELTHYPTDVGFVPPRLTEASFTVLPQAGSAGKEARPAPAEPTPIRPISGNSRTPQDAFTQAISAPNLTGGVIALALGLSFLFGALHALSPGHGKTMVAAYLVGTRGTVKHAVFLGLVVTLTHTIGVFALGLVTFAAARYIVPEKLYPVLSGLSGLGILAIGLGLLWTRATALHRAHAAGDALYTEDDERESFFQEEESAAIPVGKEAEEPLSLRSLLVLGVTGGILPCPSALVVMLSAIYLHRIAFGMLMIATFSLGLAAVLTLIGILVVRARGWLERLPRVGALTTRLPVMSAAIVTVLGLILLVRACQGSF